MIVVTLTACGNGNETTSAETSTLTTEAVEAIDADTWLTEVHAPTIDYIAQTNERLEGRLAQITDDQLDEVLDAYCTEMRAQLKQARRDPLPPGEIAAEKWVASLDGFLSIYESDDCFEGMTGNPEVMAQAMLDMMEAEAAVTGS